VPVQLEMEKAFSCKLDGKIERWHESLKESASGRVRHRWTMCGVWVKGYVEHYNNVRLNSAVAN
jgi:hypothetical protein